MYISVHHATTKGRYHENNEDCLFIGDNFIVVADGMGGECDGDIASKIAVDTISRYLEENMNHDSVIDIKGLMFSAIKHADIDISAYVDAHPDSYGMGTTVLLMVYRDDMISVAWCGDSRCYTYKGEELHSLTRDHSYVQELIDANLISVDESYSHPDNNVITRYVGGGNNFCVPEFVSYPMKYVDIVILCSDGLSGYCRDNDLKMLLSTAAEPAILPTLLTDLAIKHGSTDDITVVTLTFESTKYSNKRSSILDWFRRNHNS